MLGLGFNLSKLKIYSGTLNEAKILVNAFKTRVLVDSGTFEAEQCTINLIKSLL